MVTFIEIVSLAAADAINPCALAVIAMVLMAMLVQDPKKRKGVLLAGFAFTLAVFLLYFLYGLIIVKLFQVVIPISGVFSSYMFKGLGLLAIIIGILNIKDFIRYRPGGFTTEMPMGMRLIVKLIIKKIATPGGAFIIGLIVTLFLLPCTIMPYFIASGRLSALSFFEIIPWLIIYNTIFVSPMIAITLLIYFGLTTVEKVAGWKDRNIRMIHLIVGLILCGLGIAMFTGLI